MNDRERFIAVLEGKQPDRMPWTPRLDIWFKYHSRNGSLPEKYKNLGMESIRKDLGAGFSARGGRVYEEIYDNCPVRMERSGKVVSRHIATPAGNLVERYMDDPGGIRSMRIEHFIKDDDDYRAMEYFCRNTRYEPRYAEYEEYDRETGGRGLPLCVTRDVPMGLIIREFIGYNRAFYELHDNRRRIDSLHDVMLENYRGLQDVILDSPGRLFLHGAHFDSQMTPPPLFREYILPYLKDFCSRMDRAGKWVAIHQDADASLLLDMIREAGVHAADCLCTHPMVPLTLGRVLEAWEDEVAVWGGIPSTVLCPMLCGEEKFRSLVSETLETLQGRRAILAVADNVMPEADIERIRYISGLISRD